MLISRLKGALTGMPVIELSKSVVSRLADAETTEDIAENFFRISEAYNFKFATLMVMPARTDKTVAGLVLETQYPADFVESVEQIGGLDNCLIYEELRQTILPVCWTADEIVQRYRNLNRPVPEAAELYAALGVTMGVAIPVTSYDGARHVVRFDGNRPSLNTAEINALTLLSMRIFESYDRARAAAKGHRMTLTARELEVVQWTAAGKTSAEIGMIMELSDHTVNAYMNNAFKKLNCVNRQQLVAKALRMRVIS